MKKDKWFEWRKENASKILKSIEWAKSPTKSIPTAENYSLFDGMDYLFCAVDDLRDFFGTGYMTKKSLKRFLIKRGVSPDLFLSPPSFFRRVVNFFFAKSGHPDFA